MSQKKPPWVFAITPSVFVRNENFGLGVSLVRVLLPDPRRLVPGPLVDLELTSLLGDGRVRDGGRGRRGRAALLPAGREQAHAARCGHRSKERSARRRVVQHRIELTHGSSSLVRDPTDAASWSGPAMGATQDTRRRGAADIAPATCEHPALWASLWHPFADMAAVEAAGELSIVRGEGSHVWDADGQRYLDATASLWYCNVGHGRAEIADAVAAQMRELAAYYDLRRRDEPRRPRRSPSGSPRSPRWPDAKVFFTSGGSDSIDTATKMARRYWQLARPAGATVHRLGATARTTGCRRPGRRSAGIAPNLERATAPTARRRDRGRLGRRRGAPRDDRAGRAERVAAFFCEPVIGAGGVFAPPPGYLGRAHARSAARPTCCSSPTR